MCEATTIIYGITAVIGAASAVYSVKQQDEQSKKANKAAEIQHQVETDRARRDAKNSQNSLQNSVNTEASKFQQQKEKLRLDALREQGSARVAAGESGLGGVSAIRSFLANEIGEDSARSDLDKSNKFTQFNAFQQNRGIGIGRGDRIQNAGFTYQSNYRHRMNSTDYLIAGATGAAPGVGGMVGSLA